MLAVPARADESAALYQASWAGLPAGELRLSLRDDPAAYRGEIVIPHHNQNAASPKTVTQSPRDPLTASAQPRRLSIVDTTR